MSLDDGDCQALTPHAWLQVQCPAVYWQRAPAVLESKDQNAVMGGKCSELSAACGYECSGIHLHINLWECRSHGSDEADSWESTRS